MADMLILVVDDDSVVLELIAEQLTANGFAPVTARSTGEALAAVAAERPALVLTDVRMSPRDGYALLDELRRTRSGIPVVLMSSFSPAGSDEAARRAGADGFLRKPFREDELLRAVRGALGDSGGSSAPAAL